MVAKTEEQKAADAAEKDAKAAAEKQAEFDKAEAERVAEEQKAVAAGLAGAANASDNDDEEEKGTFVGQDLYSDHYSVVTSEEVGRAGVELRPAGWVGPGFLIPASRVKEVAKLLNSVKSLPEQD